MIDVASVVREALRATADGDLDQRWDMVGVLHTHGDRAAFDIAAEMLTDPDPLRRALAADILGQLGSGPGRPAIDGPYRTDALALLLAMVDGERNPAVLHSVAVAFGHIGDERCVSPLVLLATHADPEVRSGVVFGLLGRPEMAALEALVALSADPEAEVRDWATFGLARQTTEDFPELRAALAARLTDEDPDVRAEAIHGLAVRGDERAMSPLLDALGTDSPIGDFYIVTEALYALAATTGDPRLHPYLIADRDQWLAEPPEEELPEGLRSALARYSGA